MDVQCQSPRSTATRKVEEKGEGTKKEEGNQQRERGRKEGGNTRKKRRKRGQNQRV